MPAEHLPGPFVHRAIGTIRTPHEIPERAPIQPVFARGVKGTVVVNEAFQDGLADLEGFTYVHLIYAFHLAGGPRMMAKPFLGDEERGVFATRVPDRPNPIGTSIVRLIAVQDNVLHVEDVDMLDATPLLDIKPYVRRFDERADAACGWHDRG